MSDLSPSCARKAAKQAIRICEALLEGGCPALEVTFTVPGAHRVIEALAARYQPSELILGAGTVLDPETARIAILSGATYVVSPSLNPETVRLCNRYQVPSYAGRNDDSRHHRGDGNRRRHHQTFSPAKRSGRALSKASKARFPRRHLMPTGGVDVGNVGEWIKAGAVAVGAGSSLIGGAATGDYAKITATAREFIEKIQQAREN